MVAHRRCVILSLLLVPLALVAACDKVPLLAPTGSVITLIPEANSAPLNGQIPIVATVIENGVASAGSGAGSGVTSTTGAGTPVQNGTLITFTTTIGRIEPSEARTNNGQVTVQLITGGASGTAVITAYSGGASSTAQIKVGAASVASVNVTTTPQSLGSSGGSVQVQATVADTGGSAVSGVAVTFSTDKGSVSPSTATTDSNGVANATLTTTATAKVTATVNGAGTGSAPVTATATITVSAFGLSGFTATPNATTAGTPVAFSVTPNTNANLLNVRVNFGDGSSTDLGAISGATAVQTSHAYCSPGTYTATATATDLAGGSGSLSTTVIIGALPITLSSSNGTPTVASPVTFTAGGVTGAQVSRYVWTFDDGTGTQTTSAPQLSHTFTSRGVKNVRVDVFGVSGCEIGTAALQLDVQ
ncbi:MAG TPA: PKD domain-containing protein [Vicinamibacterales bacterium]|jgi:hypothetical protein